MGLRALPSDIYLGSDGTGRKSIGKCRERGRKLRRKSLPFVENPPPSGRIRRSPKSHESKYSLLLLVISLGSVTAPVYAQTSCAAPASTSLQARQGVLEGRIITTRPPTILNIVTLYHSSDTPGQAVPVAECEHPGSGTRVLLAEAAPSGAVDDRWAGRSFHEMY